LIKILQLFPDHLDLNGDGGNVQVLLKRAMWGGLAAELLALHPGENPSERPDVVVIGHGSSAAWKQVYGEFARLVPVLADWLNRGTQVIAVSTGFAALHGLASDLPKSVSKTERRSIFVVEEFEGEEVFGYLNSDLDLPNIIRHGNLIGTMLHGPILAKNTWLADQIIEKVRGSSAQTNLNAAKLDQIESLAKAARELSAEQAKG
jgi:lipid II isoglutaminyl synthase (glutamine-hydrolysing)